MSEEVTPNKGGRPTNASRTVDLMLSKEMIEWLGLSKRTRSIISAQVKNFGDALASSTSNLETKVIILGCLRDVVASATKFVEMGNKLLKDDTRMPDETETEEDIMSFLEGK